MIDAQPGRGAPADQLEGKAMHLVEDRRVFHAERRELVDVEEPPVVDFLRRDPPMREAIRLLVQERVEQVERARLTRACR